MVKVLLGVLLI